MPATDVAKPKITVQLCTYNRRALLGRVLQALFTQDLDPEDYEIVLVDDGSTDGSYESVIEKLAPPCALHVVRQRNAGLARGRNAGIARARGAVIMFMDDDVLATPGLLSAHVRFHKAHQRAICRGGVINVSSFDDLPPARYSWRNYSGAYFWTTNVSAPLALVREAGAFDERFSEYGWEDLELGFRLRTMGVPSILARDALVYHYKPPAQPQAFDGMIRQARAQARTARLFAEKHPHWRVRVATGQTAPQLFLSGLARAFGWPALLRKLSRDRDARNANALQRWAAARLARAAYFDELRRTEIR
ncbi:MAG TPA: glycosyltransferase family 2 protein [Candidatus Eremiobacteraceae bacterium]|nr:glycosyltransferase family 2 protein [Candidatus Eremiobacteraceae bacterium]